MTNTSSNSIVERLFGSFSVLEQAIVSARETLYTKPGVSPAVLARLDSYSELLLKQKKLAGELQQLVDNGAWADVAQKITIINGLLEMIRDDAKEVLNSVSNKNSEDKEDDKETILVC
jgi:hypothetical protein